MPVAFESDGTVDVDDEGAKASSYSHSVLATRATAWSSVGHTLQATRHTSHVTRRTSHVTSSIVEQLRSQNHPSIEDSSIPTCRAAPLHGNMGEAAQACRSAIGSKSTTDSSRGYLSCVLPQSPNKCRSSTCRFAPFFKNRRAVMQLGWYAQRDDTRRSTCCGSKAAEGQGIGIQKGFQF